ncbi:MAG: amidohydrolase family protein [Novosphingobium sp.]
MTFMHDIVIRSGTVIDGLGGPGRVADVAIDGGRIAAIGAVEGTGREEIDAAGSIVTPGFIDLHTHYDGQVTWESTLAPSSNHGVTTVVMGNCGVGFAPCRPGDRQRLIKLMEGVEDVPEVVMAEGIPWNWETFPEYLDAIAQRPLDIDIAAQVPHSALRVYVMGERGAEREEATPEDLGQMRKLVAEAVEAGAWGVSTSRMVFHRSADGSPIPSLGSTTAELTALGDGLADARAGVFQMVPDFLNPPETELGVLRAVAGSSGRPASFTLAQSNAGKSKDSWRGYLEGLAQAREEGMTIRGQVFPRPIGMLVGLDLSFNPLCRRASWSEIADLPLKDKVARLRDPQFRARILAEPDTPHVLPTVNLILDRLPEMTVLEDDPEYLPRPDETLGAQSERAGKPLVELALERMLERGGARVLYLPAGNYADHSSEAIEGFLADPNCMLGLGDGGAHYGMVCDASFPTTLLTRWVRPGGLSLERAVAKLSSEPADYIGFADRGRLEVGALADVNVIALDRLRLHPPHIVRDLPTGGRRLRQAADGYAVTVKSGVVTYREGRATGALPGRLVRNGALH